MKTSHPPSASRKEKRVFIVDDHPITREGLIQMLSRQAGLMVCGQAETAEQALAAFRSLRADVVLSDLTLPGKDGLEFIKDMQALHPGVPVLVLSMHDENIYAERALRAGARGYIMKSAGAESIMAAIRQVLDGEVYLSRKISAGLLEGLTGRRVRRPDAKLGALTDREFAVFELIGRGLHTGEIGRRLHISGKTVETHRRHIREKLKLPAGSEITSYAVRWAASNHLI